MRARNFSVQDRNAGRTRDMVRALPAGGCTVVVHNAGVREIVRDLIIIHHGQPAAVRMRVVVVETPEQAVRTISGQNRPVVVDHTFYDHARPDAVSAVREVMAAVNATVKYRHAQAH